MKVLILAVLMIASASAQSANVRGRESGGGYADFSPRPVLLKIKTELAQQIRVLPLKTITKLNVPPEWTPERIAAVIDGLEINSSPQSLNIGSDGRLKILDFNLEKNSISALAAFFLYYGQVLSKFPLDPEVVVEIKQKLVHEVSHLWGWSDEEAFQFATALVRDIYHDTLTCNVKRKDRAGKTYWMYAKYVFSTGYLQMHMGKIGFTNDDSMPTISEQGINSASEGTVSLTADQIVIKREGYHPFEMSVDRQADDEDIFNGTYQDSVIPKQKVECSFANPR